MTAQMLDRILRCPSCRLPLVNGSDGWLCERESMRFGYTEGIPDFLLDSRRTQIDAFLKIYQAVRRNEGWGSKDRMYYCSLPANDTTGRHPEVWELRARTFQLLTKNIIDSTRPGARVLDLGSGNGWLSYRLAEKGYEVVAADVNLDAEDGLLAPTVAGEDGTQMFVRVRAEFDFLPFADHMFDVIIFNASVHYSEDPLRTVQGVLGLLSENGVLYISDSPCYDDRKDGMRMLSEKALDIESKSGQRLPEGKPGTFLSPDSFELLTREYAVDTIASQRVIRNKLRSAMIRFFRRRTPASFPIVRIQKRAAARRISETELVEK